MVASHTVLRSRSNFAQIRHMPASRLSPAANATISPGSPVTAGVGACCMHGPPATTKSDLHRRNKLARSSSSSFALMQCSIRRSSWRNRSITQSSTILWPLSSHWWFAANIGAVKGAAPPLLATSGNRATASKCSNSPSTLAGATPLLKAKSITRTARSCSRSRRADSSSSIAARRPTQIALRLFKLPMRSSSLTCKTLRFISRRLSSKRRHNARCCT
mmetsp:Transcript_80926/g.234017  ORF Transcript_80926/g.234017 Transcript_80926/m.234017 type:complete len:218 (+) Transcript_80926:59-712(+)